MASRIVHATFSLTREASLQKVLILRGGTCDEQDDLCLLHRRAGRHGESHHSRYKFPALHHSIT